MDLGAAGVDESLAHIGDEPVGQTQAAFAAGGIVQDQGLVAVGAGGGILNAGGAFLADDRGLPALGAGGGQKRGLVQIIAAEFLVHLIQNRVVLQKAQRSSPSG